MSHYFGKVSPNPKFGQVGPTPKRSDDDILGDSGIGMSITGPME